ncbi:MAG: TonB-dependent receptor [Pseudomonadota bacterium]
MLKLRQALKCTTILAAASAVSLPAYAQSSDDQSANSSGDPIIVVEGTRASIANSIDAKRDSDAIVDVLSADDADRFPDNNIAESLARIPGISFQRDNDTSDGEFISIRGLDASFNTVLNNGIRVGTADTFRRTPLNVVTGDGVTSIYVTKAPLPEDATEGIGGVVDIRTRGALERQERFSVSGTIYDNSFAERVGYRFGATWVEHLTDNFGFNISASYRRRFFNNFQINPATTTPEILFPQSFTDANGNTVLIDDADDVEDAFDLIPTNFLDVENFTSEQTDYEYAEIDDETVNISGTLDWEVSDTTKLTLGGTYSRGDRKETISNIEFDADPDSFEDGSLVPGGTPGQLIRSFRDSEVNFEGQLEDEIETQQSYFLRGETKLDNWEFNYVAGYSRAFRDNPILSIDFVQELEDVPGSPGTGADDEKAVSFAPFNLNGVFVAPNPFNLAVFQRALDPFCLQDDGDSCGEIADFDEELVDSSKNERYSARLDVTRRFDGSVLEYLKGGILFERSDTTEVLIDLADTDEALTDDFTYVGIDTGGDNNGVVGDFGVFKTSDRIAYFNPIGSPFSDIGFDGIPLFSRSGLLNIRQNFRQGFFDSDMDPTTFVNEIVDAREEFYTGYLQGKLNFDDKVTIVGGVRLEKYRGRFSAPTSLDSELSFDLTGNDPDEITLSDPNATFQSFNRTDNFEVLPRVVANFNFDDRLRVRAGYTTAIARPTFDLLVGAFEGDFDIQLADGVDPANATAADIENVSAGFDFGNPNLKNAYSHNFDISAEYFIDRQNAISLAVFYKRINNFIFNSFVFDDDIGFGSDPADPGQALGQILAGIQLSAEGQTIVDNLGGIESLVAAAGSQIPVSQPSNGRKAEVYGLELGLLHNFSYLPGILSNFGFIGNMTFQKTETDITLGTLQAEDVLVLTGANQVGDELVQSFRFFNSPEFIGNATLFYESRNLDAALSYRYTGLALEEIERFGLSQFQQPRGFLDFDMDYTFRDAGPFSRLTLSFSASDILDTGRRPSVFETRGSSTAFSDLGTFNGRTFTFGASLRF